MAEVYVGLGSNAGDTASHLREAVGMIRRRLTVERVSSGYRTEPVSLRGQPDFLNAVLRARTDLPPAEVLAHLQAIERAMGRRRTVPPVPRTIDLDLLLYDDLAVDEPGLEIPHPRMSVRRFVLEPLAEIAPDLRPKGSGPTVAQMLAALPTGASVERIDLSGWPPGSHD